MFKKMFAFKQVVGFLIVWLLMGFVGRSMMKYYDMETYRSSLKECAWTNINEFRYNRLIFTGPAALTFSIFYIRMQPVSRWGLALDFKCGKILTFEEFKKLKQQKQKNPEKNLKKKLKKDTEKSQKDFGLILG